MSFLNTQLLRNLARRTPRAVQLFLRNRTTPPKHTSTFRIGEAKMTDARDNSSISNLWSSQTCYASVYINGVFQPSTLNTSETCSDGNTGRQETDTPTYFDDTDYRPPESQTPNQFYDEPMLNAYYKQQNTSGLEGEQLLYSTGVISESPGTLCTHEVRDSALERPKIFGLSRKYFQAQDPLSIGQFSSSNLEGACLSNVPNEDTEPSNVLYTNLHTPLNAESLPNLSLVYTEPPNTSCATERNSLNLEGTPHHYSTKLTIESTAQPGTSQQNTTDSNIAHQSCKNILNIGQQNIPNLENTQQPRLQNSSHKGSDGTVPCVSNVKLENSNIRLPVFQKINESWMDSAGCRPDMFRSLEGDVDVKLREATEQSFKTGTLTPLVKVELRTKIQARRHSEGKAELTVNLKVERKQEPLTIEEEIRKQKRKESNKKAAKKSRTKRLNVQKAFEQEEKMLVKRNNELRQEAERLQKLVTLEKVNLASIGVPSFQEYLYLLQQPRSVLP